MELYGRLVNFKLGRDRLDYVIYYCVQYQIDSIRRGESTNCETFPISFAFDGITMKDISLSQVRLLFRSWSD